MDADRAVLGVDPTGGVDPELALAAKFGGTVRGPAASDPELALAMKYGGQVAGPAPAQQRTFLEELGRQGALTGRYLVEGASMLTDPINRLLGMKTPGEALTDWGVPAPQSNAERYAAAGSKALVGSMLGQGVGGALAGTEGAVSSGIGNALTANAGAQAAGAAGAGLSGQAAADAGMGPTGQFLASLVGGGVAAPVVSTAASSVPAAWRFAKSAVAPFTEAGQQQIVGNTLKRLAVDPEAAAANLADVPSFVPGSEPTTAQAARDLGLAQVERAMANKSPDFAARAQANNLARVGALNQVAGTPEDLAAAIAQRNAVAATNYGAARGTPLNPDVTVPTDLLSRPSLQAAFTKARTLAREKGVPLQEPDTSILNDPQFKRLSPSAQMQALQQAGGQGGNSMMTTTGLHWVKLAMDDLIDKAPTEGIGKNQRAAMIDTQHDFLNWLDQANPLYRQARQQFEAGSKPITQMETLQDIGKRTQVAAPDPQGNPVLSQAKWKNVVSNNIAELGDVLTPVQTDTLKRIGADLDLSTISSAGKAVGSNTVQNLSTANVLGLTLGNSLATNSVAQTVARPLTWLYHLPEQQVQELMTRAMLDPTTARVLMSKATPKNIEWLSSALFNRFRGMYTGAATAATGQASQ